MHTVAEVLRPEFARSWQEAVAIVQAAASQIVPGVSLPAPEDLQFEDDGALTLGFGSESNQDPVAALAGLLADLLEGVEAPASLRDLARENARPTPAHASVASFSQALSFFERPNRAHDLRAVVGRLSGTSQRTQADEEFERLRQKVAGEPPEEAKDDHKDATKTKHQLSKRERALAVAVLLVVVAGTLGFRSGVHRGIAGTFNWAVGGFEGVVSAGLAAFGLHTSDPSAGAAPSTDPSNPEPVEKPAARASEPARSRHAVATGGPVRPDSRQPLRAPASASAASQDRTATATPGASSSAPGFVPVKPPVPQLPPRPAARAATSPLPAPVSNQVYSNRNPEVQAPVLVRPQMPREPAPGSDTGYFDILVDEHGDVEQVKLISPGRKFHDRMMVAAAKAWKFKPAMLNGQPVKYRIQVAIILPTMPGVGGGPF